MNDLDEKTLARFWAKVNKDGPIHPTLGTACWLWMAGRIAAGYGAFGVGGLVVRSHCFAYEAGNGPVPEGLELDHLCRVRHCVNPAHLEPVTHAENCRRGSGGQHLAAKTHCPKGHPYAGENLYVNQGRRNCRECSNASSREYRARRRARLGLAHG